VGSYRSGDPNVLCPAVRIRPHARSEAPPVADFETHSRLGFCELGHLAGARTIDNYDLIKLDTSRVNRLKQLLDVVGPIRSPTCNHVSHGGDPNAMPTTRGSVRRSWMEETGFRKSYVEHLAGPDSMVVGIK
jgi:hypothetical protein